MSDLGVDIIILSFLYEYSNGKLILFGIIGQFCLIFIDGEPLNQLGSVIETC
jgi:chitinase